MHRTAVALATLLALAAPLPAQNEEFGKWQDLFNKKDLAGWKTAKPAQHGGQNLWSVDGDAMTNGRDGANDLRTEAEFGDYELQLEYKVLKGGNSGVYLRGMAEVQILDSFGQKEPREFDAGAIYGGLKPLEIASNAPGEWNAYRILHIGPRIAVWLNGKLVQDNVVLAKSTPGNITGDKYVEKGPLMFQGDHAKVWYRNIRIRPLFDGWKAMWNGKDLSEFDSHGQKVEDVWKIEDGAVTNTKWGGNGGHDTWTKEPYGNFLVHYAYKSDPSKEGGNSGFYLRDQWEVQILGDQRTDENHTDGSLYSKKAPAVKATNVKDGAKESTDARWNHMDIKVQGMKIWIWQNGKLLHDGVVLDTRTDNHGVKTPAFTKAPFKFQGDHGKVWFTDLRIKALPDGE